MSLVDEVHDGRLGKHYYSGVEQTVQISKISLLELTKKRIEHFEAELKKQIEHWSF